MTQSPHKWMVFALVAVVQFMVVLDISIVNVSLPSIQKDLGFDQNTLQWVVTAYALGFGGFLMFGGRAADLFGRKRILMGGMLAFIIFSVILGFANSSFTMTLFRALQGLSAAFMSPAALSTVLTTFEDGPERHKALGWWTTVSTGGAAVGLLLGGLLSQYLSWRWNFFVNFPIGVILSLLMWRLLPAHAKESKDHHLDLLGATLVTTGLITLVYTFAEIPTWGWMSWKTCWMLAFTFFLLALFVWNESRVKHPLMPLSIFKIRNVVGANLMMIPISASMMGLFFLMALYISLVLGYSPIKTGFAFLPFPIILSFVARRVARFVMRFGYKPFLITGIVIVALAMGWLSRMPVEGHYWPDLLPAILAMPVGMGLIFMPLTVAATAGVPGNEAGLISGMVSTSQQMGGALGLAILSGVAASAAASFQSDNPMAAMVHGYQTAFLTACAFLVVALLMALFVIKQPKRPATAPAAPEPAPVVNLE